MNRCAGARSGFFGSALLRTAIFPAVSCCRPSRAIAKWSARTALSSSMPPRLSPISLLRCNSGRRSVRNPPRTPSSIGNVSGRVTALAVDPCDATGNTVYAGGADGGVWVSFNALSGNPLPGKPLTDNEPSLSTGALALAPKPCQMFNGHAQSNLILAGTGESNYAHGQSVWRGGAAFVRRRPNVDAGFDVYEQRFARVLARVGLTLRRWPCSRIRRIPWCWRRCRERISRRADHCRLACGVRPMAETLGPACNRVAARAARHTIRRRMCVLIPAIPSGLTAYAALGDPNGDTDSQASCSSAPCNGVYISQDAGITWNRVAGLDSDIHAVAVRQHFTGDCSGQLAGGFDIVCRRLPTPARIQTIFLACCPAREFSPTEPVRRSPRSYPDPSEFAGFLRAAVFLRHEACRGSRARPARRFLPAVPRNRRMPAKSQSVIRRSIARWTAEIPGAT